LGTRQSCCIVDALTQSDPPRSLARLGYLPKGVMDGQTAPTPRARQLEVGSSRQIYRRRRSKMKKPSHRSSAPEIQEIYVDAWRKLAAAVPLAIKIVTERKTKLEVRMDAGETLRPRDQRELEKIRALLDRHHDQQILVRTLLNRIGLEEIHAIVNQVATARGNR
jgi:hypothetical protein